MNQIRAIAPRLAARNDTFATRNRSLLIVLGVGVLIGAAVTARRILGSKNDEPSDTPDQPDPLQTELADALPPELDGEATVESTQARA
jgi:hypothetical protein